MSIAKNLLKIKSTLTERVQLVAVSKFHSEDEIMEAYSAGQRAFGENRVQELVNKAQRLPKDIQWHLIGHLQSNKVAQAVGVASMIQSVDSERLLNAINREASKTGRSVDILLQIHIAEEEQKFGFDTVSVKRLLETQTVDTYSFTRIRGLMGMATFTDDTVKVRNEFAKLKRFFDEIKSDFFSETESFNILSMGMSGDYGIAMEEGSNMVRIGTSIFGERVNNK